MPELSRAEMLRSGPEVEVAERRILGFGVVERCADPGPPARALGRVRIVGLAGGAGALGALLAAGLAPAALLLGGLVVAGSVGGVVAAAAALAAVLAALLGLGLGERGEGEAAGGDEPQRGEPLHHRPAR